MRQDEAGRWISDDGRYLWNGSDWLDLGAPGAATDRPSPGSGPGSDGVADSRAVPPAASSGTSGGTPGGTPGGAVPETSPEPASPPSSRGAPTRSRTRAAGPPGSGLGHRRPRRRRRPWLLLAVLLVLAVVGVGSVLLVGGGSTTRPKAAPASGVPDGPPSGAAASPPAASAVLDEQERRARADAALLTRADVPGVTEQRRSNPTDVFLPCRAPAIRPPEGSVLTGSTLSTTDFTTYVGQTVVGYPTARAAADALGALRSGVARCEPYDYQYVNSPRVDRITHTDIDPAFPLGDAGVYLVEVDTPQNYAGTSTSYSYGYVQQGQFLVRLTTTTSSKADRAGLETLMRRSLDRLR